MQGLLGSGLVLHNGAESLPIAADGPFTFETRLLSGATYAVTASPMPHDPLQHCTVNNGSGTIVNANVGNITVGCSTIAFTVGGRVTGLPAGSIKIQNNGQDELTLGPNAEFQFPGIVASGSNYSVTISAQPAGAYCRVLNASGVVEQTVDNITVVCDEVRSCDDIAEIDANAPSGVHQVTLGGGITPVYCDMVSDGGGWTLALKATSSATFAYTADLWTDATLLAADSVNLDQVGAKLLPFTSVPLTAVRVRMITGVNDRSLTLPAPSSTSLRSLLAAGASTNVGRGPWFALVPGSALQEYCNANGFRIDGGSSKVRIGIVGNENGVGDCGSADSFIGVGAENNCGTGITVGNAACHVPLNVEGVNVGAAAIPGFAYVYVR